MLVEVRGVGVYEPTTGEICSDSTDDIACWFINTAHNEQSVFVRQAYFLGEGEPYEIVKREIDEAACSAIYSTKSIPVKRSATGKIAVKVNNHYGDEVLKVFGV